MVTPDPMTAPALRWGIVAPGGIAHKFADAVADHTRGEVVAVGSRNADRAAEFARQHQIPRSYGSYEELVADPEVDAVYVASPHSHHRDQAVLAARAGKHVLVEKALARNSGEVDDIFAAADEAEVRAAFAGPDTPCTAVAPTDDEACAPEAPGGACGGSCALCPRTASGTPKP